MADETAAPEQPIEDAPPPATSDDATGASTPKTAVDYTVRLGPLEITPRLSLWLILFVSIGINVLLVLIVVIIALMRAGRI
jgi:hypothetical protein